MLRRVALVRTDVTANVVPSSPIIMALIMEALNSSETSVLKSHIFEDTIVQHDSSFFFWNITL
jgi:hypothetical protein